MSGTYIIAEIGSNHDQSRLRALGLINRAQRAGANAAKFQLYRAGSLAKRRNAEDYRYVYEATELPVDWLPILKSQCDRAGIDFMCTAYDEWGVDMVFPYVNRFKVASFELTDHRLLAHIRLACAGTGKQVVLSTGMGDLQQVREAIQTVGAANIAYLLHCTSAYPCPIEDANLLAIETLRLSADIPPVLVGLSDHTTSILTPAIAVGLGATAIEKHMTDDKTREGPDHHFAIEPHEFKQMVDMVREAEMLLGEGVKRPRESEKAMMAYRSYTEIGEGG